MPIEVRELVIRANVESSNPRNTSGGSSDSTSTGSGGGGSSSTSEFDALKKMIENKNER